MVDGAHNETYQFDYIGVKVCETLWFDPMTLNSEIWNRVTAAGLCYRAYSARHRSTAFLFRCLRRDFDRKDNSHNAICCCCCYLIRFLSTVIVLFPVGFICYSLRANNFCRAPSRRSLPPTLLTFHRHHRLMLMPCAV